MKEIQKIQAIEKLDLRRPPAAPWPASPDSRPSFNTRMYAGAKASRLTDGWGTSQTSADSEIISSLRTLRGRSRQLIRDAPFAKRAKTIVVNNIIGSGIGMQAQVKTTRNELNSRVNTDIEENFEEWSKAENCHTGGALHFSAMEQFCMGQVFDAGEIFLRKHFRPFGNSNIPYALEVIEPERVLDEFQPAPMLNGARVRLGVEVDEFHRPLAYWIRKIHPGEVRLSPQDVDMIERVSADQIIHLRLVDRWPQTRGVPWMHAVLRKLNDMDGYTEAEIVRARGQAMYMATIETEEEYGTKTETGAREVTLDPGLVERLAIGEKMNFHGTNSPNPTADPFLRFMLRELAAGTGPSYESLSGDYSQSNYSSSQLGVMDSRDLWRIFQTWFVRSLRVPVHHDFVQQGVFSRVLSSISVEQYALDVRHFEKVRFKPRGWTWVSPRNDVPAYKDAIKAGLTTRTDVIAQTANGRDVEDIDEERKQELDNAKKMGLVFDTDPEFIKQQADGGKQQTGDDEDGDDKKDDDEKAGGKNNGNGNAAQADKGKKTIPLVPHRALRDQ